MGRRVLDPQLIQRAKSGDVDALEYFLLQQRAPLLVYIQQHLPGYVRRILDPEDVLQDVYFQVFRRMNSLRATEPQAAYGWLIQITRNQVLLVTRMAQATRRGGRHFIGTETDGRERGSLKALLEELAVSEQTPSRSVALGELMVALQRGIENLPADYGQAIRLHYLGGLPIAAVARRTGHTCGSVRMLCCRGLRLLRIQLRSASRFI
ncbi:MAG: RNA polymerase sigma factor [Bacillota bacterium]